MNFTNKDARLVCTDQNGIVRVVWEDYQRRINGELKAKRPPEQPWQAETVVGKTDLPDNWRDTMQDERLKLPNPASDSPQFEVM